MNIQAFEKSMYELIVRTSTDLPKDVRRAVMRATEKEAAGTRSTMGLLTINTNIQMAETLEQPICQDTGMPTFKIFTPVGVNQIELEAAINRAIAEATRQGKLRSNSVEPLTGTNTGDNLGPGTPVVKFKQWENDYIDVKLLLKGGGCENMNIQYSLPCELEGLGQAGRDLDGICKCMLHSVYQAQGFGCSAGFIGVGIGGDRTTGYELAKDQLFRRLDDVNPDDILAKLEEYVMEKANQLGIGTMGFGGESTLLGCKIGASNRLPASFFVSVAYNCWAFRRLGVKVDVSSGKILEWHYNEGEKIDFQRSGISSISQQKTEPSRKEIILEAPITEEQIRKLRVGDVVRINGHVYTGRDAVHKHLYTSGECPVDLKGQIIYHCGPVLLKDFEGNWQVKAAGPTTSGREEPYQGDVIKNFGIRAVIGKGGMGANTLEALEEHGAVYLNAIGGAAQYYAECVKTVNDVNFLDFGVPEAMWHLTVEGFTAVVTMDSHGNSLHADIDQSSFEKLKQFADKVF